MRTPETWIWPAIALTLSSAMAATAMMPLSGLEGIPRFYDAIPRWLGFTALIFLLWVTGRALRRRLAGETAVLRTMVERADAQRLLWGSLGMLLAGANLYTFMWMKPQLNFVFPFWADTLLANLDNTIFLGRDPYLLLGALTSEPWAYFYHIGWFVLLIVVLFTVIVQPAGREKSASIIAYFALWSLFGPIVHAMMPAAGPIFYERLGLGGRFSAMPLPDSILANAEYLWSSYQEQTYTLAGGISAMPSLHIATCVWASISLFRLGSRWAWPSVAIGFLIYLLSIALGWHYALDGIVSLVGALAIHALSLWWVDRRDRHRVWRLAPSQRPAG